jgi:RND superfamily putative drug exporter
LFQFNASGVPQSELALGESQARQAQEIIDDHFAAGFGSPAYVVAPVEKRQELIEKIENTKGVDSVAVASENAPGGSMPVGNAKKELNQEILTRVIKQREERLKTIRSQIEERLAGASPSVVNNAFQSATANIPEPGALARQANPFSEAEAKVIDGEILLEATLSNQSDSEASLETIPRLRENVQNIVPSALVGGQTAIQYDTNQASQRDLAVIIPAILIAITIILAVLLRALVAPIILLLTTVVSFGSALGVSALAFNYIWDFPGADPSVVLFGFVFLIALGIDYNIFLMIRVREETLKLGIKKGTLKALVVTGGVITSAGVVLAATFAALGVIPVLFLVQIAFIVAFGVLLDTIIVRSLLVPALTLELGKYMWWPSKSIKSQNKLT